nr:MAG TPA: hypothetical protein [Caudoviricetes sp.]
MYLWCLMERESQPMRASVLMKRLKRLLRTGQITQHLNSNTR